MGFEQSAGDWTLVGSVNGITSNGIGVATPLPLPIDVTLLPGLRQAFYITSTGPAAIYYSTMSPTTQPVGSLLASDTNLSVYVGTGNGYAFGTIYSPRGFNGTIHYDLEPRQSLATPFNANNNQAGNMFDVRALTSVIVREFDLNLMTGSWDVEVWTRLGSHVGYEQSPFAWTHIASHAGLEGNGINLPTALPLSVDVPILAGQTRAFYLVCTNAAGMQYHSFAGSVGDVLASNGDLEILVGTGNTSGFGQVFQPRAWNGRLYYETCPNQNVPYQMNSQRASLTHNAINPTGCEPAIANVSPGDLVTASLQTTLLGSPYEVLIAFGHQVPRNDPSSLDLAGGQVINIPLTNPTLFYLWGGINPDFQPGANFQLPFIAPPGPVFWSAQTVYIDFTSPGGITVSGAGTVNIVSANVLIEADGANSFNSDTTSGFFKVTNQGASKIDRIILDWTQSSNPAQSTMVFDTDQTGMADVFAGGNSSMAGCLGTYRNGSDSACGLLYPGSDLSPCDPAAQTGYTGSNALSANSFQTLSFEFDNFGAGAVFEFDCDTDAGLGVSGAGMSGLVVTVSVDGLMLTGELAPDPLNPNRAFLVLQN